MRDIEESILTEFKNQFKKAKTKLELKELAMQANLLQNNDEFSSEFRTIIFFLQQHINQKLIALEGM